MESTYHQVGLNTIFVRNILDDFLECLRWVYVFFFFEGQDEEEEGEFVVNLLVVRFSLTLFALPEEEILKKKKHNLKRSGTIAANGKRSNWRRRGSANEPAVFVSDAHRRRSGCTVLAINTLIVCWRRWNYRTIVCSSRRDNICSFGRCGRRRIIPTGSVELPPRRFTAAVA